MHYPILLFRFTIPYFIFDIIGITEALNPGYPDIRTGVKSIGKMCYHIYMLYDRKDPNLYFNQEKILSPKSEAEIHNAQRELDLRVAARSFVKGISAEGDPEEGPHNSGLIIAVMLIVIAGMGFIIFTKNYLALGYLCSGLAAAAGMMLLIKGGRNDDEHAFSKNNRLNGLFIFLMGVFVLAVLLNRSEFGSVMLIATITGGIFVLAGLWVAISGLLTILSSKTVYTEKVEAECTGYVRKVVRERTSSTTGDMNHRKYITKIYTSPLFDYNYDGYRVEGIYDDMIPKKDSDIDLGSTSMIKIDPRRPEMIYNGKGRNGIALVIFSLPFIVVGAILLFMCINGKITGSWDGEIRKTGETVQQGKYISDELVEDVVAGDPDLKGKEWYIETRSAEKVEKSEQYDRDIVYFGEDDGFAPVFAPDGMTVKTGDEFYVLYTVDHDAEADGRAYKRVFGFESTVDTGYDGTHKAYRNG